MVSTVVAVVCMALATSTLFLEQVVRPRLPHYHVKISSLNPFLLWHRSDQEFKTKIRTNVNFHSDNYMLIDVHSLSFDLFFPTTSSSSSSTTSKTTNNAAEGRTLAQVGRVHDNGKQDAQKAEPIWRIRPRHNFAVSDQTLHMAPYITQFVWFIPQVIFAVWNASSFSIILPSTGIAHIKAQPLSFLPLQSPFTLQFLCDNKINLLSLEMKGVECAVYELSPGWLELKETSQKLRKHVVQNVQPVTPHGGIFETTEEPAAGSGRLNWKKFFSKMAVEEVIQHP